MATPRTDRKSWEMTHKEWREIAIRYDIHKRPPTPPEEYDEAIVRVLGDLPESPRRGVTSGEAAALLGLREVIPGGSFDDFRSHRASYYISDDVKKGFMARWQQLLKSGIIAAFGEAVNGPRVCRRLTHKGERLLASLQDE